jgi:hypothetical protein
MKYLLLILTVLLLSGCGPAYYYPEGATAMEKWQIDRYYEEQWRQSVDSFYQSSQPQSQNCSYLNGMLYCW